MPNMITLKSFPFDSMQVLNEESSQMEDDRLYEAEIFRRYFAKFLSNGVYFGHYKNYKENSMKVELDSGLTIRVNKGAGIIEGADYELENDSLISLERPSTGNRIDRVIVRLDKTLAERNTYLLIKEGTGTTPATLQRDENIYEICIAEVTVRSTSNLVATDIVDKRLNKEICGIVNSLISVDGEELYQKFQKYIDTVVENLVRKDQDIIMKGTITDEEGRGLSTNDFTDFYKKKLDELKNTEIENSLTSSDISKALSAAMGKKLNEEKQKLIRYGTDVPTEGENGDIYIQYFN